MASSVAAVRAGGAGAAEGASFTLCFLAAITSLGFLWWGFPSFASSSFAAPQCPLWGRHGALGTRGVRGGNNATMLRGVISAACCRHAEPSAMLPGHCPGSARRRGRGGGPWRAAQPASPARRLAACGTLAARVYSRLQSALHKYPVARYLRTLRPGFINSKDGRRALPEGTPRGRAPAALPMALGSAPSVPPPGYC